MQKDFVQGENKDQSTGSFPLSLEEIIYERTHGGGKQTVQLVENYTFKGYKRSEHIYVYIYMLRPLVPHESIVFY